jgi:sulfur carrier protein ThiS
MPLEIFLSSTLRKYIPGYDPTKGMVVSLDEEITVAELCEVINIPADKIKIIIVNGKNESLDHILNGDDRLGLFPAIGGG